MTVDASMLLGNFSGGAMDLGLSGRHAIVCGSSRGLGFACAASLAREGAAVVMNGRDGRALDAAVRKVEVLAPGRVRGVVADVTTDAGRGALVGACPEPDILVTNAKGPGAGDFREWDRDAWIEALDANMLAPIALIRATIDGMCTRGFGRIVNITSSAVKAPIAPLGLSNGARAGLTGFVAGVARQVADRGVTINNLLPGPFKTEGLNTFMTELAEMRAISIEDAYTERRAKVPAGRLGDPAEAGDLCAYLCSTRAGFITGQNILIDGGAYPGTL